MILWEIDVRMGRTGCSECRISRVRENRDAVTARRE
jgi:hypothetical protein